MITRTFTMALFMSMFVCKETIAQGKPRYQSGKLYQRYQDEKLKEEEESKKRQPSSVIDMAKITLLFPGVSYEKAIAKYQTLQGYALYNLYTYSYSQGSRAGINSTTYFDPTFMLSYRFYCNYDRRQKLGRTTERNNMNYLGPFAQVFFSKIPIGSYAYENTRRRPVFIYGALYGMQRNYSSHFSLDINFGLGVISGNSRNYDPYTGNITTGNQTQVTIPGQVTLSFWFGKK